MGRMMWLQIHSLFASHRRLMSTVSGDHPCPKVVLTIVLNIIVVIVVGVVEVYTSCAEGDDLLSIVRPAHTIKLVSVAIELSVTLVRNGDYVGAYRFALSGNVVAINVLGQSRSQQPESKESCSRGLHFGRDKMPLGCLVS